MFTDELRAAGFLRAALLIFADDNLFWPGPSEGIYGFFRAGRQLQGVIRKPTGSKDTEVTVRGGYVVIWQRISERLNFATIEAIGGTEHT
jgi:hypothetical protein